MFDLKKVKQSNKNTRFDRRISVLKSNGFDTQFIAKTVDEAVNNLRGGVNSFVIYGDPQSGKTEMMIALTARFLDIGYKIIVIILKDDVELLKQNYNRFACSGIDPTPKSFIEIIDPNINIGNKEWIIFCKKNINDLRKLVAKIGHIRGKVVIDDEADYATPNAKINQNEKTKINELTGKLLGADWTYIGVTATPARLDLNNTFQNANDKWIQFPAHSLYCGQDIFFPIDLNNKLKFKLTLLPEQYDDPSYLRLALFNFFISVAYLNTSCNNEEKNYCMLIHTSGKRVDMSEDYEQVTHLFNALTSEEDRNYEKYLRSIWEIANKNYNNIQTADKVTSYISANISRHRIVVMNSDSDRSNIDFSTATNPVALFTIAIGGNIVSRGVTFTNLLSMFFTRDVKHKIQQDTYIQRARMFGERGEYLRYFELTIPEKLYIDWHRCFIFHRLSLESTKYGNVPTWLEDARVRAVSPTSIDQTTVSMEQGEMSFNIFEYSPDIDNVIMNDGIKSFEKLGKIGQLLDKECMPDYLISFIKKFSPDGNNSLAIHHSTDISKRSDVNQKLIQRTRGLIGNSDLELTRYPHAIHHIKIFYNANKYARIFYKYVGNIKFIRNLREN